MGMQGAYPAVPPDLQSHRQVGDETINPRGTPPICGLVHRRQVLSLQFRTNQRSGRYSTRAKHHGQQIVVVVTPVQDQLNVQK